MLKNRKYGPSSGLPPELLRVLEGSRNASSARSIIDLTVPGAEHYLHCLTSHPGVAILGVGSRQPKQLTASPVELSTFEQFTAIAVAYDLVERSLGGCHGRLRRVDEETA